MPLQIMQNMYPAIWFYLTRHCYVRSMFVKIFFYLFIFKTFELVCNFKFHAVPVIRHTYYTCSLLAKKKENKEN